MSAHVAIAARSENAKLTGQGPRARGCSATYSPQTTCPGDCPLLHAGCYAERDLVGIQTRRLARLVDQDHPTPLDIAREEASGIDALAAVLPLRVHVVGDCATPATARTIAGAMTRYDARARRAYGPHADVRAWTYTHAWRDVPRQAWGQAAVLASCHHADDVRAADAAGYAVAVIAQTPDHRAQSGARYGLAGWTLIPCPAEHHKADGTRHATCDQCRLCRQPEQLRARRHAVAFRPK